MGAIRYVIIRLIVVNRNEEKTNVSRSPTHAGPARSLPRGRVLCPHLPFSLRSLPDLLHLHNCPSTDQMHRMLRRLSFVASLRSRMRTSSGSPAPLSQRALSDVTSTFHSREQASENAHAHAEEHEILVRITPRPSNTSAAVSYPDPQPHYTNASPLRARTTTGANGGADSRQASRDERRDLHGHGGG